MQNRAAFIEKLMALAELYNAELSEAKIWIYEQALCHLEDEQIAQAISMAAKTMRFFPKPVELIELVDGNPDEQAVMGWGVLLNAIKTIGKYRSVRFADPKISHVVEMMGGWVEICSMSADQKETSIRQAQFIKMYKACGNVDPRQLAGITEKHRMIEGSKWADRVSPIQPVLIGGNGKIMLPENKEQGRNNH